MADIFTKNNIPIKKLSLWDENARFPDKYFKKTEKELIEYFLNKKDLKLSELAEEVVKGFDLPQLEKLVIYEINGKNIVLEGNRRLAVYKLLNNPELTDNIKLKNKLNGLKSRIKINDKFILECLITKDKDQGLRYIDRKHLRGNNEVSWGDNERAHHNARRGNASQKDLLKVAISKRIRVLDFPEELKEKVLGHGFITTFWRLIEQNPAWSTFGFSLDDNGELQTKDKEFDEKLKVIIFDVLQKGQFNSKLFSRLNTKEIESYLMQITKDDYKRVANEIKKQTKTDLFGKESTSVKKNNGANRSNPKSSDRKYLISNNCVLKIQETKINNIYHELKNDLLIDVVPNAVGVLFRVFLEISLDYYAKMNANEFMKNQTIKNKISWVVESLVNKKYENNKFKNINKVGSSIGERSHLSIENFHEYVHSTTTQPTSSELKGKWDNLQEFFEILWGDLKKKAKNKKQNAKRKK
ncbi:MAG: hypothetical protein QM538_01115 [Methylacidiphilales bacterium]|nr:hypothetical protein [Candidatus Methylacidiphilales bacterium]